jgi:hypothetical protein
MSGVLLSPMRLEDLSGTDELIVESTRDKSELDHKIQPFIRIHMCSRVLRRHFPKLDIIVVFSV